MPSTTPDPPDPPQNVDIIMEDSENKKPSFKEILTAKAQDLNKSYSTNSYFSSKVGPTNGESTLLSDLEKERIYRPWHHSVVVKLMGRKISYQLLKSKIMELWKPSEPLILIDLGHAFFTAKFKKEENKIKALHSGPWVGHTLKGFTFTPTPQAPPIASSSTITQPIGGKLEDMWTLRPANPSQLSKRSEDPSLVIYGSKLDNIVDSIEGKGVSAQGTTLVVHKIAQLDKKNRSNALRKNIPENRNVQLNTVDDKTLKVMSINTYAPPEGSIHLMEDYNSSERGAKETPTVQDMTIEVPSFNSPFTNQHPLSKNGLPPNTQFFHWESTCDPDPERPSLPGQCSEGSNRPLSQLAGQPIMDVNHPSGPSIHELCTPDHSGLCFRLYPSSQLNLPMQY
ncbi:hypothetical protein FXO38_01592 [Capsicum annuum]|nr:hypothetical protein FXO38_01592 [Capsicum annuum]KAF3684041.1 hypothetical protein FXO37_01549 [Capsicum annuum]